jgi:hypothetical protein
MVISKEDFTIALWSAVGTAVSVFIFGISVFIPSWEMVAYVSSMGIAICYLTLTVANERFSSSIYARLATAFAVVYCTMVCIVYYTQLSFVRLGSPSPEAMSIVSYRHTGTAFFAIDILGYFIMSVSVLWLGLSIKDDLLRKLLVGMGIWGSTCIAVPLLPFFYDNKSDSSSSDAVGIVALSLWAVLFFPLMLMLAKYYHTQAKASSSKVD